MSDAIDGLIAERRALDRKLGPGLVSSAVGHVFLAGAVLTSGWWMPTKPMIRVVDGLVVPLPPGGGGSSHVEPEGPGPAKAGPPPTAPPATAPPATAPPVTEAVAPPPKVVKPPKEEVSKNRIPELDSKTKQPKVKPTPAPARGPVGPPSPSRDVRTASQTSAGGGGTAKPNSQFPGLDMIGPEGPGVPGGTDMSGDWYLAGVQRKIWLLWNQQIKTGFVQPIGVSFTIMADGSVTDVRVIQPSGISTLDFAAQRAVMTAAPFSPLPKDYGTSRFTIQALFKPTT